MVGVPDARLSLFDPAYRQLADMTAIIESRVGRRFTSSVTWIARRSGWGSD
jgi:hypothetical protein